MWLQRCVHTCYRKNNNYWRWSVNKEVNNNATEYNKKNIINKYNKTETNNTEIDNAEDIDTVMPMYNLIKYSDNYSKTSVSLWQYYKDYPNNNIVQSESFKYKIKITGETPTNDNTKVVEITLPLKYLSNFLITLEMPLINCEINLILTWSSTWVMANSKFAGAFEITDTKLFFSVVSL